MSISAEQIKEWAARLKKHAKRCADCNAENPEVKISDGRILCNDCIKNHPEIHLHD